MVKDLMFNDVVGNIKQQFINNGWVTVYKNLDNFEMIDRGAIHCRI